MNKKLLLIPFSLCIILCSLTYASSVQTDLADELLRLHIIAESDSQTDQEIKIKVRDAIIKNVGKDFAQISDKKNYRKALINNTDKIKKITDGVLAENGAKYESQVSFEKLYIPRKTYNGLVLPEGSYEGLIVRLGSASGQNWWCVVYPPLCFTQNTSGGLTKEAEEYLKNNLAPESYSLITEEGISIEYKFKLVELYQKAKKYIQKI